MNKNENPLIIFSVRFFCPKKCNLTSCVEHLIFFLIIIVFEQVTCCLGEYGYTVFKPPEIFGETRNLFLSH